MLITLSAELSPLRSSGLSFSTFTLPKIIFTSSRFCKYLYKQQKYLNYHHHNLYNVYHLSIFLLPNIILISLL